MGEKLDTSSEQRKMRIAFVDFVLDLEAPGKSGLSDVTWDLASEFARQGDEVHVIGPYDKPPMTGPNISFHSFRLPPIGYRNILGQLLIVLRSWNVARKLGHFDFYHAPEYISTGVISPFSRTPTVLTTPGNIYERIATGSNPWDPATTFAYKLLARSSAKWCLMVVAISSDMATWWNKIGTPQKRLVTIPYGVDVKRFCRIENARKQLNLDCDQRVVLYAGRLSIEKGIDTLLESMQGVVQAVPNTHLHILGSGPHGENLKEIAANLGLNAIVTFHGNQTQDQLAVWYSAADVFVMPSSSEPLGRVMLEAMACGAPFIGTRVSGPLDHIVDGENGFLIDVGDSHTLQSKIEDVLTNPQLAKRVAAAGETYVRSQLTWSRAVQQYREAIVARLNPTKAGTGFTGQN